MNRHGQIFIAPSFEHAVEILNKNGYNISNGHILGIPKYMWDTVIYNQMITLDNTEDLGPHYKLAPSYYWLTEQVINLLTIKPMPNNYTGKMTGGNV